jgi:hypothetical protein
MIKKSTRRIKNDHNRNTRSNNVIADELIKIEHNDEMLHIDK